ncbi:HNH endonuclease [Corynebacterium lizhenjunii]|uniref:HNH endonuclease n=1 Tax=Corynebacterium lizhenjunii TaxID=2709394 RepID=A0A7T0KGF7_9CORY|nr:HNH endonuclease family protein [Corynebacterium lizhenjunii]QPK79961.1 HNH endonuclease [Corynebacterium lizhenjunii]
MSPSRLPSRRPSQARRRQISVHPIHAAVVVLSVASVWLLLPQLRAPQPLDPGLPPPAELFAQIAEGPPRLKDHTYKRTEFGSGWGPARLPGQEACTAREAALLAQAPHSPPTPGSCERPAEIFDPYSGTTLHLEDLPRPPEADHVLPLSAAWDLGASQWSTQLRVEFANDPLNLVVTSREANQAKSDQLPSQWMPPQRHTHCWYSQRLGAVAYKYSLALPAEDLARMRASCRYFRLRDYIARLGG